MTSSGERIPVSTASTTSGAVSEQQRGVVGSVAPGRNWKDVVCPMGGPHEWEFMHRGVVSAGAVTGTAGVCSLLFCWPALFCLPLIWVGTAKSVKATTDRKCMRCGCVITHDGRMKVPPTGVPRINPATGKPNSDYGYGVRVRELPPAQVYIEPTEEPELPAESKARRDRERGVVPAARA